MPLERPCIKVFCERHKAPRRGPNNPEPYSAFAGRLQALEINDTEGAS